MAEFCGRLYIQANKQSRTTSLLTVSLHSFYMTKRELPSRSSRGQTPSYLRELPSPVKRQRPVAQKHPEEAERKEMENKRKSQHIVNLRKYPFGRAVHYFYDLASFPRVQGHLSYVFDTDNALKNTFSRDSTKIGQGCYGDLLNRKLFGLPAKTSESALLAKTNRTKNVAYSYLFQIEDKKYQIDRLICTLKVVLKKLNKGASIQQLSKFQVLRADGELGQVLNEAVPMNSRITLVKAKLYNLTNRKKANIGNWQTDDKMYFYHALNQSLHNQISDLKTHLSEPYFIGLIVEPKYPSEGVCYYFNKAMALSSSIELKGSIPVAAFLFKDSMKNLKLASQIVAKKSESLGQTTYYEVKTMVNHLFGFDPILKHEKTQNYPVYLKCFKKRCEQIKKLRSKTNQKSETCPSLDGYMHNGELKMGLKLQISGKQYILMLIFYWICMGLSQMSPIIEQYPDTITLISSDYFPKVYSSLVQVTQSAKVGMMCSAMQTLCDLFSKPDPLATLPVRLSFQFCQTKGIGVLFKECIQMQTRHSELEQDHLVPSKKVKRDHII